MKKGRKEKKKKEEEERERENKTNKIYLRTYTVRARDSGIGFGSGKFNGPLNEIEAIFSSGKRRRSQFSLTHVNPVPLIYCYQALFITVVLSFSCFYLLLSASVFSFSPCLCLHPHTWTLSLTLFACLFLGFRICFGFGFSKIGFFYVVLDILELTP